MLSRLRNGEGHDRTIDVRPGRLGGTIEGAVAALIRAERGNG